MQIEVAETHPPRPGKKVGYVQTSTGERYEVWPDKLNVIQVGRRYEVETRTRQFEGRDIVSITKVAPVADQAAAVSPVTQASPVHAGEAEYVARVIAALIASGDLDKTKIAEATAWLKKVWRET